MAEKAVADRDSWPARQQTEVDDWDQRLWDLTESRHPKVSWWWNQRYVGGQFGALCYVCDKLVCTWARSYPMTWTAKQAVMEHRKEHIEQLKKEDSEHDGAGNGDREDGADHDTE